jgi:hypothetical protein
VREGEQVTHSNSHMRSRYALDVRLHLGYLWQQRTDQYIATDGVGREGREGGVPGCAILLVGLRASDGECVCVGGEDGVCAMWKPCYSYCQWPQQHQRSWRHARRGADFG